MTGIRHRLCLALACGTLCAPLQAQAPAVAAADRAAILQAAGATQRAGRWVICSEDPHTSGAQVDSVRDLNGDGRPEAVVMEDGSFCHGHAGAGFVLLTRQAGGRWQVLHASSGIPEFLPTRGAGGWPDLSIGGPGFCFPVLRWNGRSYAPHRREYQGKACT
jgi:hypothetical protein